MSENEIFQVLLFGNKDFAKDTNLWIIETIEKGVKYFQS